MPQTLKKSLEQAPPGITRAEEFVRRLKAIDTGRAPAEVKHALAEYAAAMEQALVALKAGQDTAPFDRRIGERRQSLIDAIDRNK
jgi:hypothetical protein